MRPLLFALVVVIALQACSSKASEKTTELNADVIAVKLLPINQENNQNIIHASGLMATENEAKLSFKIGGVIESILVTEGQQVKKGQLLATIKSNEIAAQVQQVQLGLEKAQRDYHRAANLYKDSVGTLEQLQNAKTCADIARQNLQQVSFNQQYAKILAPSNGFIAKKIGNAGELVGANSPVILMNAVSASSKWILKTGVADKEWADLEIGNKASVTFDAFPGRSFPAVVSKKALAADPVSGSFELQLQVNFGNEQAAAGMYGTASITPAHTSQGFSIPYEALLEANGKTGFVLVTDDRKTVKRVEVTISSISKNVAYVSDGLQGHSFVVTSGSPYLSDNSKIVVKS